MVFLQERSFSEERNPSLSAGAQREAASPEPRVPGLVQSGQLGMAAVTCHGWEAEGSLVSGVEGHILTYNCFCLLILTHTPPSGTSLL